MASETVEGSINKTCLQYPFLHLHLSSRHGFRSYLSSLSLLAVEYDLAVSSASLLCRCSYYNNSVHELQVFESIYRGLKETTPCHPPSWLRLTAIILASGFSTSSKTSNHSASYVPATVRVISRKVARVPLVTFQASARPGKGVCDSQTSSYSRLAYF